MSKHGLTAALLLALLSLAGCDSVTTESLPASNTTVAAYLGPAPATADVQAFMTNVWENVNPDNRCGACHSAGGQSPQFARRDDINLAYSEAMKIVNLSDPGTSLMVTKVAGGHNCWLDSSSACGAVLTAYLEAWSGTSGSAAASRTIELKAPALKDAGASKTWPADASAFATIVHPLLTQHCASCHDDSAATPQAPFFANSDADSAYEAVKSSGKLDLDNPGNSRLVVRLRDEFHNCWSECSANAQAMEDAIAAFSNGITVAEIDPDWVLSKALRITDGLVASGGERHEANLVALYEFKTGSGATAYDTSGVEPALNLRLSGVEGIDYKWVGGWGIEFIDSKAQGSTAASRKLHDMVKASGEYSIEAWVVPANVTQEGPARIISYSAGLDARNFTLGQTLYNYNFLQRSSTTDGNGEPALSTNDDDEVLQATQQHVVVTYDAVNGRRIYVNGEFTGDTDEQGPGSLADWDDTFAFVLGNEVSGDRTWQGKLRLVAIHNRALTAAQIKQNFEAGVGEKFYLLFSITDIIGMADAYVMFEVSRFDDYSYLFNRPTFVTLDPNTKVEDIPLAGLRIGINGREANVGQAYRNLNVTLNSSQQVLSTLGTVIALEKGPDSDEFFLTFERLGDQSNVVTEAAPLQPGPPADDAPASDIGIRTFGEINASMAAITGVSQTDSNVAATFTTIQQQLPGAENIEGFLSSHQVAVAQLAIEYCNALVDDSSLRSGFFPGVDFGASAATAFDTTAERDAVIDPLLTRVMGTGLSTQPDPAAVKTELNALIDTLAACGGACAADRTATVVKAACAALLGSAVLLVQ
ncbi:MAG TPA: LamG domain-containing protein [Gammaproteobacteria bacterium]|nr:LamG domain-containing protein [Gammaproteobacteria bacterium]